MITISKTVGEDTPETVIFTVPNVTAGQYVGVSIKTESPNLRYSAYCDTDNVITVVLNYVPTQHGQGQVTLTDAPIAFWF